MRVTITTMQPPDIRMPAVNRHEGHACIIFTPKEVYHLQLSYKYTVYSHACVLLNLAPFFSEILYLTDSTIVTAFWKTVPNHTFLFQYIYHCNIKSVAFPIIFQSTTRNSMLKLLKECKKYSVNTYT